MRGLLAIPLGIPFVPALARHILETASADPLEMAQTIVLLPTRRGCLALQNTLSQMVVGSAILPKIFALADCEEGASLPGYVDLDPLPEAISSWRALGVLTRLVQAFETHKQGRPSHPAYAASMARELLSFVDEAETSNVSLASLSNLVEGDFASHWQMTLDFLKIITEHWPNLLAEMGVLDPAHRKRETLLRLASQWSCGKRVILAGTTGTRPATIALAKSILAMPQGSVILPGYDPQKEPVGPMHPQFALQDFISHIGGEPQLLGKPESLGILSLAMTNPSLEGWRVEEEMARAFCQRVQAIECRTPLNEARVIALIMRQALEDPTHTIALITPDPLLARRVAAELTRWGITPNSSGGRPFLGSVVGSFWAQTAQLFGHPSATEFLALLKHPLCMKGEGRLDHLQAVRQWEKTWLRGRKIPFKVQDLEGLESVQEALRPLTSAGPEARSLKDMLSLHKGVMEALAGSELWTQEDGEAGKILMATLLEQGDTFPPVHPNQYAALLQTLISGESIRDVAGIGSRALILGTLEARLIDTNSVILGGLNEGTWPAQPKGDAWLNRPMREALGFPPLDRKIGLSAHDFCLAFSCDRVFLTRALKEGGAPTVPSRWWQRLEAVLSSAGHHLTAELPWITWAETLDTPPGFAPVASPDPRPPASSRPKKLSVTAIEKLRRDPYAFYARYILNLKPLDPIDDRWSAVDRGEAIHAALEKFVTNKICPDAPEALEILLQYGQEAFGKALEDPHILSFWWPRFERIAEWFIKTLQEEAVTQSWAEVTGSLEMGPYTITAQADRIDLLPGGYVRLIDYKTGTPPTGTDVKQGFSPQLSLEGLILQHGGFPDIPQPEGCVLNYCHLTGGTPAGEMKLLKDPDVLIQESGENLGDLLASYGDENTPFLPAPNPARTLAFNDYEHLSRQKEWGAGE